MSSSEEYLASLGFDTSDVDKAVNQTVTLLGHLGNAFEGISPKTEKAERALLGTAAATKKAGNAARGATADWQKLREQIYDQSQTYKRVGDAEKLATKNLDDKARAQQVASQQTALYNQYLYDQEKGLARLAETSPRVRYALYDVARVANVTAIALAALGTATAVASASYESSFTNVERTLEPGTIAVGKLREQLIGLTRQIPLTFQEITGIATLGNQLGIEGQNITEFTGTVARFSAVAGVSFDETAKAFGSMTEILGVSESQYENLGSAIALVGRRSVATEQEILSLTREIGQQANQAGFTAEEVVGLAGALGELRVPPERARGSLTTYFGTLNRAVAQGGQELEDFATVIGVTSDELSAMVRGGKGLDVFQRFLAALSSVDTVDAANALERLGLSQLRVSDVFQRLASNTDVFNQSIANGRQGWTEGTELARQYALVVDDLASRWQIFLNNLMTFGAAVGDQVAPALKVVIDGASAFLNLLTGFVNSPFGGWVTTIVVTLGTLVAAYAALRGGLALATASLFALNTAAAALGGAGIKSAFASLIAALGLTKKAADGATTSFVGLRGALAALGRATIVLAILQVAAELIFNFAGSMETLRQPLHFVIDLVIFFAEAINNLAQVAINSFGWLPGVGASIQDFANRTSAAVRTILGGMRELSHVRLDGWISGLQSGTEEGYTPAAVDAAAASFDWADGLDAVGSSGGGAAAQVRTLVDYANDLSSVMKRSFEIRFGGAQGADAIASGWQTIRDSIFETNQQIKQYSAQMQTLASDKAIREYWLSVAENYGDTLRAGQLRAEIAEIDGKLESTSRDLTKAQQKNSKTLVGNSEAARDNRSEILGLVTNYQDYLTALASSGLSQAELARKSQQLKAEFIAQATQLGYSASELATYTKGFDDMAIAIANVPRNITVTADVNPAIQALNELEAKARQAGGVLGGIGGGIGANGARDGATYGTAFKAALDAVLKKANVKIIPGGQLRFDTNGKMIEGNVGNLRFYRSGTGWTGSGNPNDIAGIVHNRERVLNERGSRLVSEQFVNAANQGRNPWQYAPQAASKVKMPGSFMVELSPVDRELIAGGKPVVVQIASSDLANATSASDDDDNRRGGA